MKLFILTAVLCLVRPSQLRGIIPCVPVGDGKNCDGKYASISEYPHVAVVSVSCHEVDNRTESHYFITRLNCGATILNQWFLLTTAVCVRMCKSRLYISVGIGAQNRMIVNHTVDSFWSHSDYERDSFSHDIALIKTKRIMELGENVKRAIIMRNPPKVTGGRIAGWGRLADINGKLVFTQWLRSSSVKIRPAGECFEVRKRPIPVFTFCAEGPPGKPDKYFFPYGYNGQALVVNKYIVIGVNAYAHIVGDRSKIVFVNVTHYYDWIIDTMRRMHC